MNNCPNCGSPIEPYKCKCEYCGTSYFDFSAMDFTDDKPCYVKFKCCPGYVDTPVIITSLVKPSLNTIMTTQDTADIMDRNGNIKRFTSSVNCDIQATFRCITNPETNTLYTIKCEE